MFVRTLFVALILLGAGPAAGHEFWLEPSTYRPPVGSLVSVRTLVGEEFIGDKLPRNEEHFLRFVLAGAAGESPMLGTHDREPAGIGRVAAAGIFWILYESRATAVAIEGETLERYLVQEGLEPFFPGDRRGAIEDRFSRCAKSLLVAGEGPAKGFDQRLGCSLELIPEADPSSLASGSALPLRLLQAGKALPNVQLSARNRAWPTRRILARTDREGRASLPLGAGIWLVNAVWMRPAAGEPGAFESLWASLTFEVTPPETRP